MSTADKIIKIEFNFDSDRATFNDVKSEILKMLDTLENYCRESEVLPDRFSFETMSADDEKLSIFLADDAIIGD